MNIVQPALINNIYNVADKDGNIIPNIIGKLHRNRKRMDREVKRLQRIRHLDGVAKIIETKKNIIFIEKIEGDDLINILKEKTKFSEDEALHITRSLVKIVKSLHDIGIIHYDIKPGNIMYNETTKQVTLIDFEYERHTIGYSPPEIYTKNIKSFKTDVWSIGATVYTMCMGYNPYSSMVHLLSGIPMHQVNPMLSRHAKHFFRHTMNVDYDKRLTIEECLEHPWLKGGVENKIKYFNIEKYSIKKSLFQCCVC